jgi:Tfp pilus assembly protein PilO
MGKKILLPLSILIITIVIAVGGASFVYGQITSLNQKAAELKAKNITLREKVATLEKVKEVVVDQASTSRFALPSGNVSALALAQIKKIAEEEGVLISEITASGGVVEGKETNEVRFEVKTEGDFEQTKNFFVRLGKTLPMINIEEFSAQSSSEEVVETDATLVAYWSPLPENVQGVTGTLSELTGDEINLITKIAGFEKPVLEELSPQEESPRDDPFNLSQ